VLSKHWELLTLFLAAHVPKALRCAKVKGRKAFCNFLIQLSTNYKFFSTGNVA
jgi:hypothetical protein